MHAASPLPMPAMTPAPCRRTLAIAISSTRSGTPNWRRPVQGFLAVADMAISQRELETARTARAVRTARADARAADLAPLIAELRASGVTTLQGIAAALNARKVPTD